MSISATDKQLVRGTFKVVADQPEAVAQLFYNRLFEIAPEVQPLFAHIDIKEQGKKLMMTLSVAVNKLDDLDTLVLVLEDLGRRHVKYGVKDEHYAIVGEALLWTLEKGLGARFTPEVKQAWTNVYTLVATVAIRGAQGVITQY